MSQLYRDPWRQREAWRSHPVFSTRNYVKNFFPGFGIAVVAFSAYVFIDNLMHPSNISALKEAAKKDTEPGHSIVASLKTVAAGESLSKDKS